MADKQDPTPGSRAEAGAGRGTDGRFQKGVSGNPDGRPKSSREFRELSRTFAPWALKRLVELTRGNGNAAVRACEIIIERAFGRMPMEVSGPGGQPIDMRFRGAARNAIEELLAQAAAEQETEKPGGEN